MSLSLLFYSRMIKILMKICKWNPFVALFEIFLQASRNNVLVDCPKSIQRFCTKQHLIIFCPIIYCLSIYLQRRLECGFENRVSLGFASADSWESMTLWAWEDRATECYTSANIAAASRLLHWPLQRPPRGWLQSEAEYVVCKRVYLKGSHLSLNFLYSEKATKFEKKNVILTVFPHIRPSLE